MAGVAGAALLVSGAALQAEDAVGGRPVEAEAAVGGRPVEAEAAVEGRPVEAEAAVGGRPVEAEAAVEGRVRSGEIHVVRPGETLWTIAAEALGDASLWPALFRANRDQIKDPDALHPGQSLEIPTVAPGERRQVREKAQELLSR